MSLICISHAFDDRILSYIEHLESELRDVNQRLADIEKRHMLEFRSSTLRNHVDTLELEIRFLKGEEHGA